MYGRAGLRGERGDPGQAGGAAEGPYYMHACMCVWRIVMFELGRRMERTRVVCVREMGRLVAQRKENRVYLCLIYVTSPMAMAGRGRPRRSHSRVQLEGAPADLDDGGRRVWGQCHSGEHGGGGGDWWGRGEGGGTGGGDGVDKGEGDGGAAVVTCRWWW